MTLTETQLNDLGKDKEVDDWIELARDQSRKLKMHFYGTGLTEFLTKIQSLESDAQIALRKKYAVSNSWVVETLLRAVDNVWSAKGGLTTIDAPDTVKDSIVNALDNVTQGYSLDNYLQHIWFDRFVTDPNGLLFNEVNEEDGKTYLVYKSIFDIVHMKMNGIQPEYIVFAPDVVIEHDNDIITKETGKTEYFWIVDDAFYYRVSRDNKGISILDTIPNSFGVVPATQNSPLLDTETGIKVSPIHKQVELLDSYVIDSSISNIYKKLNGFPITWMYAQKCDGCKGSGEVNGDICKSCNGTKQSMKKDVSDVLLLATPKSAESPTIAPNVAGHISPDLDTWREQRTELEYIYNLIYYSQWGTTTEKADNETATGRFIDAQPVINRLNMYGDVIEVIKTRTIEFFAMHEAPNTIVDVHVSEGRRYLVETPDQIWKKYLETIEKGADESSKDLQLSQYYEAEWQSDDTMRDYYLKLMKIEPLVHYNIPDVLGMEVGQNVKDMKIAFPSWKNITPIADVITQPLESLINSLKSYTDGTKETLQQPIEVQTR